MERWKERKESGEDNLRVKSQQTFPFDPGECLLCHCGGKKNRYSPIQVSPLLGGLAGPRLLHAGVADIKRTGGSFCVTGGTGLWGRAATTLLRLG